MAAPGYLSEVHHVIEWAKTHRTDIDDLTFACGPDHKLPDEEGWTTRKNADGITEWIPPPHLDFGHRGHKRLTAGEMSFADTHRYADATAKRCHSPGTPLSWCSATVVEFES